MNIGVAEDWAVRDGQCMNPAKTLVQRPATSPTASGLFLHVLYDSPLLLAAARRTCERTCGLFQDELNVQVLWTHFQQLADERYAREAAEVAAQSDVVIVATSCQWALPGSFSRWLGEWMCQTHKPDGAFCGLFQAVDRAGDVLPPVAVVLAAAARLTRRTWIVGSVPRPPAPAAPAPPVMPSAVGGNRWEQAPLCHGING